MAYFGVTLVQKSWRSLNRISNFSQSNKSNAKCDVFQSASKNVANSSSILLDEYCLLPLKF